MVGERYKTHSRLGILVDSTSRLIANQLVIRAGVRPCASGTSFWSVWCQMYTSQTLHFGPGLVYGIWKDCQGSYPDSLNARCDDTLLCSNLVSLR